MNKFILKHGYFITFVILVILSWFVYRQFIVMRSPFLPFAAVTLIVWGLGTFVFVYFWLSITYTGYKKPIVQRGLGGGPIPVNTLYAVPNLASPSASGPGLLATGTNDLLYIAGWLALSKGARVLHVPDFSGRYYSVQFTTPRTAPTSPMSARARLARRRAVILLRGQTGKERYRAVWRRYPHRTTPFLSWAAFSSEATATCRLPMI